MVSDIIRFSMPVHYETEHGEQFNKSIREEILRTNRHNPSRDVSVAFARRFIIHHVISGGSFLAAYKDPATKVNEIRRVVDVSFGIKNLKKDEPEFFVKLFESRENADNNDYVENPKITAETSGLFCYNTPTGTIQLLGAVTTSNKDTYIFQHYKFEVYNPSLSFHLFDSFRTPLFSSLLTTEDNNPVISPVQVSEFKTTTIQLKQRLDMHTDFGANQKILNIHKFGSLWPILQLATK